MATAAQIHANRLNALKSTGPSSVQGKAAARFNAFKHGAYARALVISGEDEADYLAIAREYYDEFQPQGIVETELVDTLIRCHWEKHRVPVLEAAAIRALVSKQEDPGHALGASLVADALGPNVLHKLFRRGQAAHREWSRAEADLRRRQAERLARPAGPGPPDAQAEPAPAPAPQRNEPDSPEPEAPAPSASAAACERNEPNSPSSPPPAPGPTPGSPSSGA